jgi:23S rRNA pseudouridine1911/1915/1917 synthase
VLAGCWEPAQKILHPASYIINPLQVLYEDNHLLAVNKPPGLPTQGAAAGKPSVVTQAKAYLKRKYRKPGNVYLGVVSRLDMPASGVVILARTSKAAARLSEQFRSRRAEKIYWAIVDGRVEPASGQFLDFLAKDERNKRMAIVAGSGKRGKISQDQGQEARLSYKRLQVVGDNCLLEIALETGRKHQIRLQLAARGHPIVGDRKYRSRQAFPHGIALHCRRLVVEHPVKKTRLEITARVPSSWKSLGK